MKNLCVVILIWFGCAAFSSLGEVALNAAGPLNIVSSFVSVGALFIAFFCFFAALVKYFAHKRNPLAVPFGKVVWLVILGFLVFLLPLSYILTGNGIELFSLWNS